MHTALNRRSTSLSRTSSVLTPSLSMLSMLSITGIVLSSLDLGRLLMYVSLLLRDGSTGRSTLFDVLGYSSPPTPHGCYLISSPPTSLLDKPTCTREPKIILPPTRRTAMVLPPIVTRRMVAHLPQHRSELTLTLRVRPVWGMGRFASSKVCALCLQSFSTLSYSASPAPQHAVGS
jgi:hypothetical protein